MTGKVIACQPCCGVTTTRTTVLFLVDQAISVIMISLARLNCWETPDMVRRSADRGGHPPQGPRRWSWAHRSRHSAKLVVVDQVRRLAGLRWVR